jgi:hypothetical protein
MITVILLFSAVMAVLPVVAWIGFMIWAARRDGDDEDEFKRTHPPT